MFRQVLVPVKFSVCGRLAARHACDVVRAIGGTVTLLHVLEHSGLRELETPGVYEAQFEEAQFEETQYQEALALLRQLGLYARRPPGLLVVPSLSVPSLDGSAPSGVASAILDVAAGTGAELIMLGLRSQDGPGILGQVVTRVLLGAGVPVQVTPCHLKRGVPSAGWRGVLAGRE